MAWSFTTPATARFIMVSVLDEETDIVNTDGTLVSAANFGAGEQLIINGLTHGACSAAGANLTFRPGFEGDYRSGGSGLPGGSTLQTLFKGIAPGNPVTMTPSTTGRTTTVTATASESLETLFVRAGATRN